MLRSEGEKRKKERKREGEGGMEGGKERVVGDGVNGGRVYGSSFVMGGVCSGVVELNGREIYREWVDVVVGGGEEEGGGGEGEGREGEEREE